MSIPFCTFFKKSVFCLDIPFKICYHIQVIRSSVLLYARERYLLLNDADFFVSAKITKARTSNAISNTF